MRIAACHHEQQPLIILGFLHSLTTPLILHANCGWGLRELLLGLALAVRLVLFTDCLAAGVLCFVSGDCISRPLIYVKQVNLLSAFHAVVGLHI